MKKFMAMLLVLTLSGAVLAGCTTQETNTGDNTPATQTEEPANNEEVAEGEMVKIGLGHITSIAKSRSAEGETTATGQVDTTIVAAGFDAEGKVVSVTIDVAQTKVGFDADLQLATDTTQLGKTKVELGDEYGMKKASQIGKEWYEQAAALEEWMIGKTVDEIKAMEIKDGKAADAELTSSVTVSVEGYIAALEEAFNNAIDIEAGAVELGLGTEISMAKSKSAEGENGPVAQVDTVMTVGAFDKDGKVVGAIIDNAQTKINFDAEGKLTTDVNAEFKSKNELKDEYGMIKASTIGKEWYEQAAALAEWMEGQTIDEIKSLKVKERDASHKHVPDVPELTSSVTITVESYLATIAEAKENAR